MFWPKVVTKDACKPSSVHLTTQRSSYHRGAYAVIGSFLVFSMLQFRDGPFIRPHPAFWRIMLGANLLYELTLVFLLFQELRSARDMMKLIDSNLGVPLPQKNYAENCQLTRKNIWVSFRHRRFWHSCRYRTNRKRWIFSALLMR